MTHHPIGGFPVCRHVGQNRAERLAPGYQVKPEECIKAFRTVKVGAINDPELPLSFRSHYEEWLYPRLPTDPARRSPHGRVVLAQAGGGHRVGEEVSEARGLCLGPRQRVATAGPRVPDATSISSLPLRVKAVVSAVA